MRKTSFQFKAVCLVVAAVSAQVFAGANLIRNGIDRAVESLVRDRQHSPRAGSMGPERRVASPGFVVPDGCVR